MPFPHYRPIQYSHWLVWALQIQYGYLVLIIELDIECNGNLLLCQ